MKRLLVLGLLLLAWALPTQAAEVGTARVVHIHRPSGAVYATSVCLDRGPCVPVAASATPDTRILHGDRVLATATQAAGVKGTGVTRWRLEPLALRAAAPQATQVIGAQPTAVFLINFSNDMRQPVTLATITSWLPFTDRFLQENSYGTVSMPSAVFGWFTLPMPNTGCAFWSIQNAADQAATAAGVNLSAYVRRVYLFPYTRDCQFGGMGTVGGNPSFVWINGEAQWATMNHEVGHTEGLYHSHSLACTGSVLTPPCTTQEYGDVSTTMGSSSGHFAVFQKLLIGWLGTPGMPPVTTVAQSGLYAIDFYDTPLTLGAPVSANHRLPVRAAVVLPKALKIPRGATSQAFYVRLSRPGAFDKYAGVFVSMATEGQPNSSYLLDMTPATKMNGDQFLAVGQTFTDPVSRIALTTISVGPTGAVIQVAMRNAEPPPPPPTGSVKLLLTGRSTPGREMTFSGTLEGATFLSATVDGTAVALRYITVDVRRKTWVIKTSGLLKGAHTIMIFVPSTSAAVSVTFVVPK